jgi:hypothetical protein
MHAFDFILVRLSFVYAAAAHVLLAKPCHAHFSLKAVAKITSLVSPSSPRTSLRPSYTLRISFASNRDDVRLDRTSLVI